MHCRLASDAAQDRVAVRSGIREAGAGRSADLLLYTDGWFPDSPDDVVAFAVHLPLLGAEPAPAL